MRKAVGIPKLKAISKGKLCVWKNFSPKSLLNNFGKDDDPHPINGLCEIKFNDEDLLILNKYKKFKWNYNI